MASSFKTLHVLVPIVANVLMLVYLSSANLIPQQVPCLFVIGDSLFDNGNNNGLVTEARANYRPYGIDFPKGPTGRFSNGKNMADVIATLLGFDDYIKPYATVTDNDILKGVNYASGGSGMRDESGSQMGDVISLNRQLSNHQRTISSIATLLGSREAAAKYIHKCIYIVGMGSNDYINNYLMPESYSSSSQYNPQQYANALAQQYSQQLRTLYKYGARKVAIFGLGQIGCIPFEVAKFGTNGSKCVDKINENVQLFNDQTKSLVDQLNHDFVDAKFIYINMTNIQSEGSSTPGLNTEDTCCVVSTTYAKGQCAPNKVPCILRLFHEYYDAFHPTEFANIYAATRAYFSVSTLDAYPHDIKHLAQLSINV